MKSKSDKVLLSNKKKLLIRINEIIRTKERRRASGNELLSGLTDGRDFHLLFNGKFIETKTTFYFNKQIVIINHRII